MTPEFTDYLVTKIIFFFVFLFSCCVFWVMMSWTGSMRRDVQRKDESNPEPTACGKIQFVCQLNTWGCWSDRKFKKWRRRTDWSVLFFLLSEQRKSRGSKRSMWRRDSCRTAAQTEMVNHLKPPKGARKNGPVHPLTPSFCFRSGEGRCRAVSVSGRVGRRPGCNGSSVGAGGGSQREHWRGGGAHGADRSCCRGKT